MKKLWIPAAMVVLLITLSLWLSKDPPYEGYVALEGSFEPAVTRQLADDWSLYKLQLDRPEQAYCITRYQVFRRKDGAPRIHVEAIEPAKDVEATPISVSYNCGAFPAIHTHPPADCELLPTGQWSCTPLAKADTLSYCMPSEQDVKTVLEVEWHRFGVVQCTSNKFVFFSP